MKSRASFVAAALLLSVCAAAGDAGYKDLKIQDLMGGSWPEFAAELDSLLANPRNEDAFYRMYKIAQRCDAESKVPQFLLKLNRDHPEKKQIQTLLGLFYRENRDYAQAVKYFREALKKTPGVQDAEEDYFVHYQLAHLLGKQDGDASLKEALEHYRIGADRIGASDIDLKTRMLEEWGQLLIDRSGDNPDARKSARDAAAQVWDRLIADERRFDKLTYERLAQIYQRTEMWDKAIATYRLSLTTIGDDNAGRVRVLDEIGALSENLSDFPGACTAYSEALGLVDETHWLHKQLVVKLVKAHKKSAGNGGDGAFLATLQKAAADRPQSTVPLRDLALAHESLGDGASTIRTLEQAAVLAPRDVTLISDLLLHYSKLSGPDALNKKAELYRKLAEVMPENFDAYVGLADTYFELGDTAKAQDALNMLQNTASTLPEKYLVMAGAYRKFGMKSSARNAYERALSGAISAASDQNGAALEYCDFCLACAETEGADKPAGAEFLQRALELRSGLMAQGTLDESGYLRLMEVFKNHQRPDEARDIIGYASTNVFPKSFVCRSALADLHYSRKEFYKAIQHYVKALEIAPSFYFKRIVNDRITTLTWNYGRHGKDFMSEPTEDEKSKKLLGGSKGEGLAPWIYYLQELVSSDPQNPDNMMLLAQINENTVVDAKVGDAAIHTDPVRAKALYKSVVDMDLKNLDAHAALARTLVMTDEFEGAIQENWILEELSPVGKWQYVMNVGDLWALAGYRDKSLQNWNTVSEQATTEPNLVYQLGCRMFQAGKIDDAIALVRKASAANKNEFRFHTTLGNLLDLSSEKKPAETSNAREEAVREFKTSVEMAGQNAALTPFLQPVLRRLLDVEIRLARAQFQDRKFTDCAQSCSDALAVIEKLKDRPAGLMDVEADVQVLRARTLLTGDSKAGDALLRSTVSAHPDTRYWIDDALKISGTHMLALFESGKLSQSQLAPAAAKPEAGFNLSPAGTGALSIPGRIGAVQKNSDGALFLEGGGSLYRMSADRPAIEALSFRAPGLPLTWLGNNFAAIVESSAFSLIDLNKPALAWKADLSATSLVAGDSHVACFHFKNAEHADAKNQPAPALRSCVTLFDKATGHAVWEIDAEHGAAVFTEKFLIVRGADDLVAIRLENGAIAWRAPLAHAALWRSPVRIGETILLVDDMANDAFAFDLKTGALKFQRALGASLLCEPVHSGQDQAIFQLLQKRIVTLKCLDTATGRLLWESSLQTPAGSGASENLGGISLAPVLWNNWLLNLDAHGGRIWAVRSDTGNPAPPIDLKKVCPAKLFDDVIGWGVSGDSLYLASRMGCVARVKLVK